MQYIRAMKTETGSEFVERALRARDEARRTGDYVDADEVIANLQRKLDSARVRLAKLQSGET